MHFQNAAERMGSHSGNELLWKSHLKGKVPLFNTLQFSEGEADISDHGREMGLRVPVQAFSRACLCLILPTRGQLVSVHSENIISNRSQTL